MAAASVASNGLGSVVSGRKLFGGLMLSLGTLVWLGSPVSQCGMACQATLHCSNVSLTVWLARANRSAFRYMGAALLPVAQIMADRPANA